ncbi:unnamed protein product [Medioppia subpectinata]|uniref:Ketoreductase domain-containing protein n=1 Tax=Medioppia subpectinata TaxID=1979941 RepID=A0A7R9KBS7_9ACAR|nr:unnamed protein product [Medioppia subpectinata]CAG2100200.1 unnamed protein product [Medioppia subpectinata]
MKFVFLFALFSIAKANLLFNEFNDFDIQHYKDVIQSRNFTDKVVLITGSSSGIGEGIAKLFAVLGAKVVVTARKEADVHKVALELEKLSPYKIKPLEVVADLTKSEDITRLVDQTIKTFGKIDVLVNNAGGGAATYIKDTALLAAWDQVFNIDLRAVVELIHTAIPYLEKTNGTIIDTSSIAGTAPRLGMLAYNSAKAALNMLAKVLALELGPKGIRVNTISPGYTEVESHLLPPDFKKIIEKQTPLKRIGQPLDMAKAVAFLASSDADFITGAEIVFTLLLALFSIVKANEFNDFDIQHYKDVIQSRNFTDKVVLITGSSSGIGEGIAKLFAVLGAKVVVTARKEADVHRVALELEKLSPYKIKPLEIAADLTKSEDINRLVDQTIKTFGKLDVLVNNAGIGLSTFIKDTGLMATWDQVFNVDLRAVVELTHTAVPYLEKTNGTIIDTSSILDTAPRLSAMAYNCAKAALTMLAKVLALELGPKGIRVNTISPGFTEVESHLFPPDFKKLVEKRTPLKRIGQPLDMAKAVAFLASSDADFITGADIDFTYDDYKAVAQSRNFTDKVILVTGSSSGIGAEITKLFSILGARVVVTGRKAPEVEKVAKEVQELSPKQLKPLQVVADLTKTDDLNRLLDETIKTFGKLDVLVNNAGIYFNTTIADANLLTKWDQIFAIDLRAVVQLIQQSVPHLKKTNGTIIDISAIEGTRPMLNYMAYDAAVAARDMMGKVVAMELGSSGVRINSLSPGFILHKDIKVPIDKQEQIKKETPLGRPGFPLDIARGVAFLASSDAQFITGINLVVDGGLIFNMTPI